MKKFFTLLALMCVTCISAWADFTPKTVEGTTQYCYTLKCHGSGHANVEYIGLTETSFNGHSANGTRFVFEPTGTDGQYYLRSVARNKYINAESSVTFDAVPHTYWTIAQNGDYFFLFANGDNEKYLNNNESSGVGLRVGNFNGECSQWTATEYNYNLPTVPQDAKLYRFKNKNYNTNDYITADGENLRGRNKVTNNTQWFFTIESETASEIYFASAVDGRTAQDVSRSGQEKLGYNKATTFVFDEYTIDDATYYGIRQSGRGATDQNSSLHRDGSSNIVGWASKDNATTVTPASMWKMEEVDAEELGSYLTAQKAISHALEAAEQGPAEEFALRFKISTVSQKYYYTLKDSKGRNRYAYYNGDDQLLGTDGSGNNDNRIFYFTQSDAQKALSNSSYMVVSIHNIAAEAKEMTAKNAWGTTETNWYIKISPNISEPNYIAICPNSNFDGNSWNDHSTTVNSYGANDPNSAWELTQVSNVKNFTVQVSGLPVSTDMAGVTVRGKNYNNGATVEAAYIENMTAMEVPGYTSCITGYNNDLRIAYTEKIKATTAPENGEWATNTTWYYIKSKNSNGYISAAYKTDNQVTVGENSYAGLMVNNTTKPTDNNGLWALVFNSENNTYKIYNRETGGVIANCGTADNKKAYLAPSATADNSEYILEPGVQAGTYCIRINGTTNARWNNRDNYLSTWTSNDSFYGGGSQAGPGGWGAGAAGSQYVFEVYVPEEAASLPNSWNNYSGDNQTEWTQGTSDIVTANTANKTSHYYHDWDFQTETHSGSVTLRFQYGPTPNGSARLDISCVELLNADGTEVLSSDVHTGFTGGQQSNRDYTIKVPAKNTAYKLRVWSFDTRNSHGTITYMNWGDVTASEFEVAEAKSIMSEGVGYPKATTTAYTALTGLTAGTITKDAVADAKSEYMACTDVNFPVNGKAYTLISKCPTNNGYTLRYMKYTNGAGLSLVTEESEATKFLAIEFDAENHKYGLVTPEGTFVVEKGNGNTIGFNSNKGYSEMYNEDYTPLTFARQVTGRWTSGTNADMFGLMAFGGKRADQNNSSYFVVGCSNGTFNQDGGYTMRYTTDYSTGFYFKDAEGVTAETAGYADGVEKYTLYTIAKANNTTYASYFGEGLGKYHYGDNQTTGYMDAVKACTTLEQERNVVPVSINQPEAGKFYTFKGVQSNKYMTVTNGALKEGATENAPANIFYVEENGDKVSILSYTTGLYVTGTSLGAVEEKAGFEFGQAHAENGSVLVGEYRIRLDGVDLCSWGNGDIQGLGSITKNDWEGWEIVEVDALPVTMVNVAGAYYASLHLPVAVTLPAGVTAYSGEVEGDVLTLTEVVTAGDLKAYTPVILYSANEVTEPFAITTDGTGAGNNDLIGTLAAESASEGSLNYGAYVLNKSGDNVGFYKTTTKINGFKAYLAAGAVSSSSNALSFRFEDVLTAIEAIQSENSGAEIFDLQGRRLTKAQKGMNIINGHKVLVK